MSARANKGTGSGNAQKLKERRKSRSNVNEKADFAAKNAASWSISGTGYKTKRTVSDRELKECKKLFFELDRDGSGSIDVEEIAFMLKQLGQSPTEAEIKVLIDKFDTSKDGKIQLREFMDMYAMGLDNIHDSREEDYADTYRAVGADPKDPKSLGVTKVAVADFLKENYGLDVELDELFDTPSGPSLTFEEFKKVLRPAKAAA